MPRLWTRDALVELVRSYQAASVLAAAADLNLFAAIGDAPAAAGAIAGALGADLRGTTVLLDALAALGLLEKSGDRYAVPPGVAEALGRDGTILATVQHQAACLRRWAMLSHVVKSGRPTPRVAGVRGSDGDRDAFILAMNDLAAANADSVIRRVRPLEFRCVLDAGGGSGTWTVAWLRACPAARAILFDLPAVIPLAARRFAENGLTDRVTLVEGDFYRDPLPAGADLAWISAIVHQNSRAENRDLFCKVGAALADGGRIAIRDHLMQPSRTEPVAGALFAVNMLVSTERGGTYTFEELTDDLEATGFRDVTVAHREPTMNCVVVASKR